MLEERVNRNVRLLVGFQIGETLWKCVCVCVCIHSNEGRDTHLGKQVEIEGVWMIKVILIFKG